MESAIWLAALSDIRRRIQAARKWQETASLEEVKDHAWQLEVLERMHSEIFARLMIFEIDWEQRPDGSIGTADILRGDFELRYSPGFYGEKVVIR
ncbi:Hypothetical protein DEACI_3131 [Acididesulfobacillus acetoxydans]|uniref:Uncharacterized protein n=1 Tax=Acididesulfobacillus acetoxydans TaxID=1561005 RepID=A0A8S0XZD5_9FIRM|nr:hypothetical protein [Acididesulfobacillus acetoxydans]CAA7602457.1 Hypothetical protein DEACI_3131 [Acididesulfobacillus acetoxydans]CEJ05912.1 Hypothetical protein DEACI_0332 [Acididesulfobacillus acetoxydans]